MTSLSKSSLPILALLLLTGRAEAVNRLFIAPQTTTVGATQVTVPIRLDNDQKLYAFSLSLSTSLSELEIVGLNLTGTPVEAAGWSFGQIHDGGARVSWGVVLDVSVPFDAANVIPVGQNLHIANLVVDVNAAGPDTASIVFQDVPAQGSTPAEKNVLVDDKGAGLVPTTQAGTITIEQQPVGGVFHRGDSNNDGNHNISDPVNTLNALFLGTGAIPCQDAADSNDDGQVNISDPVNSLNVLFLGVGNVPPPLPPESLQPCGADPTAEAPDLGCGAYDC